MFARITPYKLKPGTKEAALARTHELKDEIMALPGVEEFINVLDDDGNGYVVSLVDSREVSDANAETVKAIWGKMSEFLAEMPVPEGYEVQAHWQN